MVKWYPKKLKRLTRNEVHCPVCDGLGYIYMNSDWRKCNFCSGAQKLSTKKTDKPIVQVKPASAIPMQLIHEDIAFERKYAQWEAARSGLSFDDWVKK